MFIASRTGLSPRTRRPSGGGCSFFFSPPPFTQALRVRGRSGNNIVKVAVTPKTTKCRLSHRTLQAATAKYRRGGPPAVIARHSSPRERRGVHRHYTRGGRGGCAAIRPCSASCYFFRHFCNRPLSCTLFRAVEVNVRGRCSGNILQSGRATRCEVYVGADNDWLNYFDHGLSLGATFRLLEFSRGLYPTLGSFPIILECCTFLFPIVFNMTYIITYCYNYSVTFVLNPKLLRLEPNTSAGRSR